MFAQIVPLLLGFASLLFAYSERISRWLRARAEGRGHAIAFEIASLKVVLPVSLAGILTAVIFAFTLVTQEFVYGVTFITASSSYTVSVGVPTFLVRGDVYFWGSMMAACLIASVPIATIYNFFVARFVAGFTMGAIK